MSSETVTGESKEKSSRNSLTLWILGSIIAALLAAWIAPRFAVKLELGGEIFLNLLKMIVVPLVITSVMSGVLGLGDIRKLGKPGGAAIGYYLATTLLAVVLGLVMVNLIQPGTGMKESDAVTALGQPEGEESPAKRILQSFSEITGLSQEEVAGVFHELPAGEPEKPSLGNIVKKMIGLLFTDNLIKSALDVQLLPLIVFSLVFAGVLTMRGSRAKTVIGFIEEINDALMDFVLILMKIAPIGIFCLVASEFGEANAGGELMAELQRVGKYMLTVLAGLAVHSFVTLPAILWVLTRRNPFRFIYQMSKALLTAFSTASSSATLPVTMECAIEEARVSEKSVEFVTPIGATINMDGTALYEAVAAIFIAQAIGFDLTFADQVTIAITATLAAIGAAGIPQAGLVTMLIVLNAVGLPTEALGLILSVDWLLDRFRTAVNVFGDAVGAAVVEKVLPE